jgi:hypothetical protein
MVSSIAIEILSESEILADILAIAQDKGVINQIFEQSKIYIYYSVFARVFGNLSKLYVQYLNSVNIEETRDEALLEQLLKPFVEKQYATVSKTILRFRRRSIDDYTPIDILIEAGTRVQTEDDDPVMFRTAETKILRQNAYEILVPAYSIEYGQKNNVSKNTLTYFISDLFAELECTNIIDAYGGQNEETAFDARTRMATFRYSRDGSESYISNEIMGIGIGYPNYSISQYYGGSGSLLISLDIDSIEQYYDIIERLKMKLFDSVSNHFARVERIYVNLGVNVGVTGSAMYDSYDIKDIKQNIVEAINQYFGINVYVGYDLSIKRLEAFILNYLVTNNFEIYEIDITIGEDSNLIIDHRTGEIVVEPYQKLYANKLQTEIMYNKT